MLKTLLLATATSFALMTGAQAAIPYSGMNAVSAKPADSTYLQVAKQNRGGDGQRGGNDDGPDDDHGGNSSSSSSASGNSTSGNVSGSGRKKPRIPGGSGCDDPGDVAEHASCAPAAQ